MPSIDRITTAWLVSFCLLVPSVAVADSLWDHNGSVMRLVANGEQREFRYEKPREILRGAGVKKETVLFDGYRVGNKYVGRARMFSKNCSGPLPYDVSGDVVSETRVVLKGRREVYNDNCRPTGRFTADTLVFTYLSSDRARGEGVLSEEQALIRAIAILKGDPYGSTANDVARHIVETQLITAGTVCGDTVRFPVWQFHVVVPENVVPYGNNAIDGYLVVDERSGRMVCATLPFLD